MWKLCIVLISACVYSGDKKSNMNAICQLMSFLCWFAVFLSFVVGTEAQTGQEPQDAHNCICWQSSGGQRKRSEPSFHRVLHIIQECNDLLAISWYCLVNLLLAHQQIRWRWPICCVDNNDLLRWRRFNIYYSRRRMVLEKGVSQTCKIEFVLIQR